MNQQLPEQLPQEKNRIDLLQDGLEEIEELKKESESKNDSIIMGQKDDEDDITNHLIPIRESHDTNPLSEDDYAFSNYNNQ